MNETVKTNVNYLKYSRNHSKGKRKGGKFSSNPSQDASVQGTAPSKGPKTFKSICYCCPKGKHSTGQKCPALEAICRKCKKKGHYATICQCSKSSKCAANLLENSTDPTDGKFIAFYKENGTLLYMAETHMLLTVINKSFPSREDFPMEFPIGLNYSHLNGKVLLEADTGADMKTLNEATFKELFPRFPIHKLCPNDIEFANYGNSYVNILGSIQLFIKWQGKVYKKTFHVTDANGSPNLLSRKSCFMMEILKPCFHISSKKISPSLSNSIQSDTDGKKEATLPSLMPESVTVKPLTKEQVLKTYKDVFEGIGTFPRPPYKFKLKPNAVPAQHSPWKVPIHLKEAFHKEVYDLVDQGILEPVEHSYVIVEKEASINSSNSYLPNHKITKKLSICLDPHDLNEVLE